MTEATAAPIELAGLHTSDAAVRRLRQRYAAERRFKAYGIVAIALGLGVLALLLFSIVRQGYTAFVQTNLVLDVYIDPAAFELVDGRPTDESLARANYQAMAVQALVDLFPEAAEGRAFRDLRGILSSGAGFMIRDRVMEDPRLVGQTIRVEVPAHSNIDQAYKGNTPRDVPENRRRVSDRQYAFMDALAEQGRLSLGFNWILFTAADSRQPELAGIRGAVVGSFYLMLITLVLSLPIGIGAAIYLEEFAPKNRWSDLIEVNINNLAAVPSIVFGLLGLAVFIQIFGLPRSAPLVGGLVLTLMTLPTIIIATRASFKAVPPSIREAAYGLGASRLQVVLHHVLPLAMPGILTGTIIGLAQALGETAPLLMIGMNAFITEPSSSIFNPSTALPTQIYIWADSSERGFVERTSAGIIILLGFLISMNSLAIYLRRKFERRW